MRRFYGENLTRKSYDFFLNNCCLNIVIYSIIFCNCYNSVYPSGFLTRRLWELILARSIFFYFFFLFFLFKDIESVWGSNIAPPSPIFLNFLNIVQYLFCTLYNTFYSWFTSPIPHITPYPQHCFPPPPPTNSSFTSNLTPPHPRPPPKFFFYFFFEFSQKVQIYVHIHPYQPPTPPPPHPPKKKY